MEIDPQIGIGFLTGEAFTTPTPDNNNWRLTSELTPAEFMQWVRREKQRLHRELLANPSLLTCPEHRRDLTVRLAMEKCALWHYYGVREA
jgi:hypothetical protein